MKTFRNLFVHRGAGLGALVLALVGMAIPSHASTLMDLVRQGDAPKPDIAKQLAASKTTFMRNKGQWQSDGKYLAQFPGLSLWLTNSGWRYDQSILRGKNLRSGHVVQVSLSGAKKKLEYSGSDVTTLRTDFLFGKKRVLGVRSYRVVTAHDVYPKTSVKWYIEEGSPRFDFVLAPGADPRKIAFDVKGADRITLTREGDIVLWTSAGTIIHKDLKAYQVIDGKHVPVNASFKLISPTKVGFEVGDYDRSRTLVIDPLVYGSYYGGDSGLFENGFDEVRNVVADADFGVFVTGWTESPAFPNIAGPYGFSINGSTDAFFSKFQGDAYSHDYSAYIGGSGDDTGMFVGMDPTGQRIWMAGTTTSADFPGITGSAFQASRSGSSDIFLLRFTKDDTSVVIPDYSTYYGGPGGGSESLTGMAVAPLSGEVVLTGTTTGGLPTKNNTFLGGATDVFFARFAVNGSGISGMKHCFYVGGNSDDEGGGIAVDSEDNVVVSGNIVFSGNVDTSSNPGPFMTTPGVYANGRLLRNSDAFVRKYDTNGNILYSVLLGGNGHDSNVGVAVDPVGNAYLTGIAGSFNFPRTPGVFGENFTANPVVYVTKINQDASNIVYSTHLNTSPQVGVSGIGVDSRGTAWVSGIAAFTHGPLTGDPARPSGTLTLGTIPVTPGALDPTYESPAVGDFPTVEGYLIGLTPTATSLVTATYLGGLLDENVFAPYVDRFGDVWVVGSIKSFRRIQLWASTLGPFPPGPLTPPTVDLILPTGGGPIGFPASLISAFAFKTLNDQSVTPNNTHDGGWPPPFFPPTQWARFFERQDGFLIKIRETLPTITGMTLTPSDVAGGLGASATGNVTLSGPVPAGGIDLVVTLDDAAASFSAGGNQDTLVINLPGGATNAQFTLFTNPVTSPTAVNVRAEIEGNFFSRILTVEPWLQQLTITPTSVVGGNNVTGRVTLWQPAINDITIDLSTDTSGLVEFPNGATVTVPAGAATATFVIATNGVEPQTDVPVTASLLGVGKTAFVRLLPASLASVTFNPGRVTSGSSSTGTVTLDGEAGSTFVVDLTLPPGTPAGYSLDPIQLTFNAGDRSKTFTINTAVETVNTQRIVTATRPAQGGYSLQAITGTLFVDAANLIAFTVNPNTLSAGQTSTGSVTINVPAGSNGAPVTITSSDPAIIPVTSPVVIPAGATSTTFNITAANVALAADTVVTITASRGATSIMRDITVLKSTAGLSFNPSSVVGGASSTGTLTLAAPAGVGGLTFTLVSDNGAVTVPGSVTVLEGDTSVTFTANTSLVGISTLVNVTATSTVGSITAVGQIQVTAIGAASITFNPSRVRGPQSTLMTVTIDAPAPAGGLVVGLSWSNPSIIQSPPASVTVAEGQTSVSVTVATRRVSRVLATLATASAGGKNASAVLTVTR